MLRQSQAIRIGNGNPVYQWHMPLLMPLMFFALLHYAGTDMKPAVNAPSALIKTTFYRLWHADNRRAAIRYIHPLFRGSPAASSSKPKGGCPNLLCLSICSNVSNCCLDCLWLSLWPYVSDGCLGGLWSSICPEASEGCNPGSTSNVRGGSVPMYAWTMNPQDGPWEEVRAAIPILRRRLHTLNIGGGDELS